MLKCDRIATAVQCDHRGIEKVIAAGCRADCLQPGSQRVRCAVKHTHVQTDADTDLGPGSPSAYTITAFSPFAATTGCTRFEFVPATATARRAELGRRAGGIHDVEEDVGVRAGHGTFEDDDLPPALQRRDGRRRSASCPAPPLKSAMASGVAQRARRAHRAVGDVGSVRIDCPVRVPFVGEDDAKSATGSRRDRRRRLLTAER